MNWWLVTAYTVFFVGVFTYTFLMSQRQKDLDRRIDELRNRVEEQRDEDR